MTSAVLLVQKEYAERLAAAAGTPAYGSLTLFARYHALLEPLMTLRASAFWPRPDVDSMLVRFRLREEPPVEADEEMLFRIIRGSFQMRRKQLANTLAEHARARARRASSACAGRPGSTAGAAARRSRSRSSPGWRGRRSGADRPAATPERGRPGRGTGPAHDAGTPRRAQGSTNL